MKKLFILSLVAAASFCLCGCAGTRNSVIASTGTCLGVDVSENPSTGLYHAKLGYARTEFAYVPTNKGDTNCVNGGATDVSDVIMELKFQNMFSGGGVYQRLAIGKNAVMQPGASLMFAKDSSGVISSNAAALASALGVVPAADAPATAAKVPLAKAYQIATDRTYYDAVAKQLGYPSFVDFLNDPSVGLAKVKEMYAQLKAKGIPLP